MKYVLLLNNDRSAVESWQSLSPEEAQKLRAEEVPRWNELFAWVGQQGVEIDGLELDDADKARVVRVRDGERLVSDGPFAETKELIGGYFLADCKDLDQAIELAQRVPVVFTGS
ncbi:MAG TPA: YciI family protein, partial [Gaiellaceae bacterium]|nr:YciI family protein [Gaiellaceae bacterium]